MKRSISWESKVRSFHKGFLAAGAMSLVVGAASISPVFALNGNGGSSPVSVDITKTLTKETNTPIPDAPIVFNVRPAIGAELTGQASVGGTQVYEGVPGVFDSTYTMQVPADPSGTANQALTTYNYDPITLNPATKVTDPSTTFPRAGLYRYIVEEQDPTFNGLNETAPTTGGYYIDVYVTNNNNSREISDVIAWNTTGTASGTGSDIYTDAKVNALAFTNDYDTHFVKVDQVIAGNAADTGKIFKYNITLTPSDATDSFVIVAADGTKQVVNATAKSTPITLTLELTQGQSFTIYGLSPEDSYSITENDAEVSNGTYQTAINQSEGANTGDTINTNTFTVSGKAGATNDVFTFTNTRTGNVPTAFFTTYGPYVAGLALLGGLGYAMFGKKKKNG